MRAETRIDRYVKFLLLLLLLLCFNHNLNILTNLAKFWNIKFRENSFSCSREQTDRKTWSNLSAFAAIGPHYALRCRVEDCKLYMFLTLYEWKYRCFWRALCLHGRMYQGLLMGTKQQCVFLSSGVLELWAFATKPIVRYRIWDSHGDSYEKLYFLG
jgi:hypothetical protein